MIVADLGGQDFVLASVEDAEALLGIVARAKAVRLDYHLPAESCYVEDCPRRGLEIKLSSSRILTGEEAKALLAESKKAEG